MVPGVKSSEISGCFGSFRATQTEIPFLKKGPGTLSVQGGNTFTLRLEPSVSQIPKTLARLPSGLSSSPAAAKAVLQPSALEKPSLPSTFSTLAQSTPALGPLGGLGLVGSVMSAAAPEIFGVGPAHSAVKTAMSQFGKNVSSFLPGLVEGIAKHVPQLAVAGLAFMPKEAGAGSDLPLAGRLNPDGLRAHPSEPDIHVGGESDRHWLPSKEEYLAQPARPEVHGGALPPPAQSLTAPPRVPQIRSLQDLMLLSQAETPEQKTYPLVVDGKSDGSYSVPKGFSSREIARTPDGRHLTLQWSAEHGYALTPLSGTYYQLRLRDRSQLITDWRADMDPERAADYYKKGDFGFQGGINKKHEPDFISRVTYENGKVKEQTNVFASQHLLPRADTKWGTLGAGEGVKAGAATTMTQIFEIVRDPSGKYMLMDSSGNKTLADGYFAAVQKDQRMFTSNAKINAHLTAAALSPGNGSDIIDAPFSARFEQGELIRFLDDSGYYTPNASIRDVVNLDAEKFVSFPEGTDALFGRDYSGFTRAVPVAEVQTEPAGSSFGGLATD